MEHVANTSWLAKLLLVDRADTGKSSSEDVDRKHPKEVEPEKERGASNTITLDKLLCDRSRVTNVLRRMAHG